MRRSPYSFSLLHPPQFSYLLIDGLTESERAISERETPQTNLYIAVRVGKAALPCTCADCPSALIIKSRDGARGQKLFWSKENEVDEQWIEYVDDDNVLAGERYLAGTAALTISRY